MPRMVQCVKMGEKLPGLKKSPFPGDIGEKIYENISEPAWRMWLDHQVNLINHNGLVLADPNARKFLMEQMLDFLFGDADVEIEGWTPPRDR